MLFFSQDVMLVNPGQEKARKKMFERMKELGYRNVGIEFLFINIDHCKNLEKLERKAGKWKSFLEKNFENVHYSIHSPWRPDPKTNFLTSETGFRQIKELSVFRNDFVDVVNMHIGHGIPLSEWEKNYSAIEAKEKTREKVLEKVSEIADNCSLCIETMPPEELDGVHSTLSGLPSDFEWFFDRNKKLGMTVDTCHTGITRQQCIDNLNGKWHAGFYSENIEEIKKYAERGDRVFLPLAKKINHLHYSDLGKFSDIRNALHGAVPGNGYRGKKEMIEILKMYENVFSKKKVSVVLEINEADYTRLENIEKAFELLKSYQYS